MQLKIKKKRGFTLIELLVVVLIIAILAAVALPQYRKAVLKARVAEYEVNLKTLAQAVHAHNLENGGTAGLVPALGIDMPECKLLPEVRNSFDHCIYNAFSDRVVVSLWKDFPRENILVLPLQETVAGFLVGKLYCHSVGNFECPQVGYTQPVVIQGNTYYTRP